MLPYVEAWLRRDRFLSKIARHMLGLFAGRPGARAWKRHLSENAHREGAGIEVLLDALGAVPSEVLDERATPVRGAQPSPG